MIEFLKNILKSKGYSLSSTINGLSHPRYGKIKGIKWGDLVKHLESKPEKHREINKDLSTIQHQGGDVINYLIFQATEMIDSKWSQE